MNRMLFSTIVLAATALAGCADMQNRPNTAAPGTTWTVAVRNTGSFGNQNIETRTRVAGEKIWLGRPAFVYERPGNPAGDIISDPENGRWIALAKGDAPIVSFDPPLGWNWPLAVGETWTRKHKFTNHATKQSGEFVGTWKVESYEDVTVRAGTFRAFKVVYSDTTGNENTTWYGPELGINVKVNGRRTAKHPAGPGTNDIELVSRPSMP